MKKLLEGIKPPKKKGIVIIEAGPVSEHENECPMCGEEECNCEDEEMEGMEEESEEEEEMSPESNNVSEFMQYIKTGVEKFFGKK